MTKESFLKQLKRFEAATLEELEISKMEKELVLKQNNSDTIIEDFWIHHQYGHLEIIKFAVYLAQLTTKNNQIQKQKMKMILRKYRKNYLKIISDFDDEDTKFKNGETYAKMDGICCGIETIIDIINKRKYFKKRLV